MKINILGTQYTVIYKDASEDEFLKDHAGFCDFTTKEIVISKVEKDYTSYQDLKVYINDTIRHEIIHAFLFESGLDYSSDWARNEEVVDWIALQLPKLYKACKNIL